MIGWGSLGQTARLLGAVALIPLASAPAFAQTAAAPAEQTGSEAQGRACSRFSQHVVADTLWHSPQGKQYLLVAGSRHVTTLRVGSSSV